jgi:glyoxylase-like metal-dependent hydrolase (beta-lactamase superfamily II)
MKPLTSRLIESGRQSGFCLLIVLALLPCPGCNAPVDTGKVATNDHPQNQSSQATERRVDSNPSMPATQDKQVGEEPAATTSGPPSALDAAVKGLNQPCAEDGEAESGEAGASQPVAPDEALLPLIDKDWIRLHPQYEVWLDTRNKQVIVGGRVCFRDGPLEMFACPRHTKEHESIVSTMSNGEIVHVGLLATGAVPGKPVQWDPGFVAASGPVVHVTVVWTEDGERREIRAQELITDMVHNTPMQQEFVYCGSGEWRDPDNPSYREFWADSGDLICVSNFSTALMDVQIESSSAEGGLMFHANPDKIPGLGTPVLLFLKPELDETRK